MLKSYIRLVLIVFISVCILLCGINWLSSMTSGKPLPEELYYCVGIEMLIIFPFTYTIIKVFKINMLNNEETTK